MNMGDMTSPSSAHTIVNTMPMAHDVFKKPWLSNVTPRHKMQDKGRACRLFVTLSLLHKNDKTAWIMRLSVDLSTFRGICPIIWVVLECVYCLSVKRERERSRPSHDLCRGNRTTSGSSSQHARNYAQPRLSLSRRPFLDRWFNYRLRSSFSCFPSLITSVSPFLSFSSSSSSFFFFSLTSVLTKIFRQVSFLLLPSQLACPYLSFSPLSAISPARDSGITQRNPASGC